MVPDCILAGIKCILFLVRSITFRPAFVLDSNRITSMIRLTHISSVNYASCCISLGLPLLLFETKLK